MEGFLITATKFPDPTKLLGYLNFSDGRCDPKFQRALAELGAVLAAEGPAETLPERLATYLLAELERLHTSQSPAFRDIRQAQGVIQAAFREFPRQYRQHHADLLAHQSDADLFTPLFLVRVCEAVLQQGGPWEEIRRLVRGALHQLNDYVGYRPIAILHKRKDRDYYPHEKVRPIPLYIQGVGVGPSKYAAIVARALELLQQTDPVILDEAAFQWELLEELAFDPRAHDHFHPINKRPNVLFGEWDPHHIDGRGYYRRFVLRQLTLDTLMSWVEQKPLGRGMPQPHSLGEPEERLLEAAAVLAGTILMGAGICGASPQYHDSNVSLARLVPRVARYRDAFYEQLLRKVTGPQGDRLREEAQQRQQPFASVRQYLNQALATQRAAHLQDRRLAQWYAAMGYPQAARRQAAGIHAPAVRFNTEIRIRQTEAAFAAERGQVERAARCLAEVEDLLRRGIDCGALIDPWNILGFQGLFPIFPGREDTVRDPRAEELIELMGRQFDLYSLTLAAAACREGQSLSSPVSPPTQRKPRAGGKKQASSSPKPMTSSPRREDSSSGMVQDSSEDVSSVSPPLSEQIRRQMQRTAEWWDQFATHTVSDLPQVIGRERVAAAERVARALADWAQRQGAADDISFWKQQRTSLTTPAAFAQVVQTLIHHRAYRAAMALLMTWLAEGGRIPLQDTSASLDELAHRWLHTVTTDSSLTEEVRATLIRRFLELLEANAEEEWLHPERWIEHWQPPVEDQRERPQRQAEFETAYLDVTYRDSTDDGQEGSVADADAPTTPDEDFPLEGEIEKLEQGLRFLLTLARLLRQAVSTPGWLRLDPQAQQTLRTWHTTLVRLCSALRYLLEQVSALPIPPPASGPEGMIHFDRRRALKGHVLELAVSACVECEQTARTLVALLLPGPELPPPPEDLRLPNAPSWEPAFLRILQALVQQQRDTVRQLLPAFIHSFRHEPLLYCPLSDGAQYTDVLRTHTALQVLDELLSLFPHLGLIRETFQLTKLARQMEWNQPPEGRRISSFDHLFHTALRGVVETLLDAAGPLPAEPLHPASELLFHIVETFQGLWLQHSQSLRLSILETLQDEEDWESIRRFIRKYGSDLFTVQFLVLSNMRGIIARGTAAWLDSEAERAAEKRPRLVEDWAARRIDRNRHARILEWILQALIEHYDEYRDYNATTTQSDYGENLHIFLDFLRLKSQYERYAWRLRPLATAHEVLCRRGQDALAQRWREHVAHHTAAQAEELLQRLHQLEQRHGIRLRTIRDRLEERFLFPFEVDLAVARVAPAATAAAEGHDESHPAFVRLTEAIAPLAARISGVGLDVPAWVRRLEEVLRDARQLAQRPPLIRAVPALDDLRQQLADWDRPISES
jgi:hypothetical protein